MSESELYQLWDDFLKAWPVDRVRQMKLEEYTNADKDTAFIYWLESRVDKLGSIWGGSAFKFGIFHRADDEAKPSGQMRLYSDQYAWYGKYGKTAQEAFLTVRARIVQTIEAVQANRLEEIDEIDFSPAVKWKIAFLYQPREKPQVLNIFTKDCLFYHYRVINPSARKNKTPFSLMYASLLDQHKATGDVLAISDRLWKEYQDSQAKYWAVPVGWLDSQAEVLCQKSEMTAEDVPAPLMKMLGEADLSVGDHVALLVGADVRAVGIFNTVDSGEYSWKQTPVNVPADLISIPTSKIKELEPSEYKALWKRVPKIPGGLIEPPVPVQPVTSLPGLAPSSHEGPPCIPRNIILYGPPGTGKTYSTTQRALELILGSDQVSAMSAETQMRQFRHLQQEGQIEFVTFHQSYGYEEFVEGIRPLLGSENGEVQYELHDGVFKRIALRAAAEGLRVEQQKMSFDQLWTHFIRELRAEEGRALQTVMGGYCKVTVTRNDNLRFEPCKLDAEGAPTEVDIAAAQTASRESVRLIWNHREELGPEPEKITSEKTKRLFAEERGGSGGYHYAAIRTAYREILTLEKTLAVAGGSTADRLGTVQEMLDKPTAGRADFGFSVHSRQYVLIIDEINRGNASKILGELITLLEPDKRLGTPGELKLPLTYSPEHRFAVPPNLHIIGTMNTADRSIALMDVAMRRRFEFKELMPDVGVIRTALEGQGVELAFVDLVEEVFNTLNARIRFLYDRDHQLGHSYFLCATDCEELRKVFVDRGIPLLQEYFYGAWDKICMVLGCPFHETGEPRRGGPFVLNGLYAAPIIQAKVFSENDTLGFDHDEYENRVDYTVNRDFLKEGLKPERLIPYFLGILNLDGAGYGERKSRLEEKMVDTVSQKSEVR